MKKLLIRIFFFLRISFLYLLTFVFGLLIPKKKNLVIVTASKGRFYNGNARALFEYMQTRDDLEAYYFVSKKDLFNTLTKEQDNIVYHYSWKGLYLFLRARTVCITHGWADMLGFAASPFQNWVFLGHGVGTKALGYLKENLSFWEKLLIFSNRYFIYTINSDFDRYMFSAMNHKKPANIKITGYPRMDSLFEGRNTRKSGQVKNILYAPTYRKDGITELFPFSDFDFNKFKELMENLEIDFYIRFHPNNYEDSRNVITNFFTSSERIKDVSPDVVSDIQDVLLETDVLITDFSSISRDFLFLERPMIFVMNGLEELGNLALPIREEFAFCGYKVRTYTDFKKALKEICQNRDSFVEVRRFVKDLMYNYVDGDSSKRVVELIKELA